MSDLFKKAKGLFIQEDDPEVEELSPKFKITE